jgi:hypothetical protein
VRTSTERCFEVVRVRRRGQQGLRFTGQQVLSIRGRHGEAVQVQRLGPKGLWGVQSATVCQDWCMASTSKKGGGLKK